MSIFLQIIGGLWAFVGLGNIVMMFPDPVAAGTWDLGVAYNMALYIIPGMAVLVFGRSLRRRRESRK
jgi:hypothetical protein